MVDLDKELEEFRKFLEIYEGDIMTVPTFEELKRLMYVEPIEEDEDEVN